jgi:hypothetical protein
LQPLISLTKLSDAATVKSQWVKGSDSGLK